MNFQKELKLIDLKDNIKITDKIVKTKNVRDYFRCHWILETDFVNCQFKLFSNLSKIVETESDKKQLKVHVDNYISFLKKNNYFLQPGNYISIVQILAYTDYILEAEKYRDASPHKDNSIMSPILAYYCRNAKINNDIYYLKAIALFDEMNKANELDFYNIMQMSKKLDPLKFETYFQKFCKKFRIPESDEIIKCFENHKKVTIDEFGQCSGCKLHLYKQKNNHDYILSEIDRVVKNTKFTKEKTRELYYREKERGIYHWKNFISLLHSKKIHIKYVLDCANIGGQNRPQNDINENPILLDNVLDVIHKLTKEKLIQETEILVPLHERHTDIIDALKNITNVIITEVPRGYNDDWYALYASIFFDCKLITNDILKDHSKTICAEINNWKKDNVITIYKKQFIEPKPYTIIIQQHETDKSKCHIPIIPKGKKEPEWFCCSH